MTSKPVPWTGRTVVLSPSDWDEVPVAEVFVRESGDGFPLVYLHGGWGYGVYPFDVVGGDLVDAGFRLVAPDRTGYGRSTALEEQPLDFHHRAAAESIRVLDALGIEEAVLWGHSDGAVIAVWMALARPKRFRSLVLESLHVYREKPASRSFFESAAEGRARLGPRTQALLEEDHGPRWPHVVEMNARPWVGLARTANHPHRDLYQGRLRELRSPTLLLHGRDDPRTEPGEIQDAAAQIAHNELVWVDAKHAPHADPLAWAGAKERVLAFLRRATVTTGA